MPKNDRPPRRWSVRHIGTLAVVLTVALALLVLLVSEGGHRQLARIESDREASMGIYRAADTLRRTLLQMEDAKRGYMLTGRDAYLALYRAGARTCDEALAAVEAAVGFGGAREAPLVRLVEAAHRKRAEMDEVLRLFDGGDRAAAQELMLADFGREQMARIDRLVDEVIADEDAVLASAARQRALATRWSRAGIWLLVGLCLAGAFVLARLARDRGRERATHLRQLSAERDRLDEEVVRRTAETEELARHMERVREDERARLARELHDELGGLLTAVKLDVARLRARLHDPTGTKQQLIAHIGETLDAGIALKRRIIEDLRPSSLANLGLRRTLEIQCAEFAQRAELPVHAEVDDVDLSPESALAVYRLVQEALTNVAKYAHARQVRVVLQGAGGRVVVRVEDDGVGFDPLAAGGGNGIKGMRFRIRSCGGDMHIRSAPGQGTTVHAVLLR